MASPAQKTLPLDIFFAYILFTVHVETESNSIFNFGSPTRSLATLVANFSSTLGAGWLMSYPHTMSHSFQGLIILTRPIPIPPMSAPG